jgi:putative DNA methylase
VLTKKKLIEVALPLPEINDASAYDKMPGIGAHPKGVHHWWARLPLPTARAVLFASVVDDPESHPEKWPTEEDQRRERERLFDIMRRMMQKKLHTHPDVYEEAWSEMLKHFGGDPPVLFDPFAGGGSIPLEGMRLGFEVLAGDLNPVAVLLNRCTLEFIPHWCGCAPVNLDDRQRVGGEGNWSGTQGLAADVRYYSDKIERRVAESVGHLYPKAPLERNKDGLRTNVIAWIWAHTVASPDPAVQGRHVPLVSSFVLSTKGTSAVWVEPVRDAMATDGWRFTIRSGSLSKEQMLQVRLGTKAAKGKDFVCFLGGNPIQRCYIQAEGKSGRLRERLMAVVADGASGKLYLPPEPRSEALCFDERDVQRVLEARIELLSGALPTRAEITGGVCTAYGYSTWGHLLSNRQTLALLAFSDAIRAVATEIGDDALRSGLDQQSARSYAITVSTLLALAADRCADFNNRLCRWSPSNQKVMNLFGKQALPMVFDYAEANMLGSYVGSWSTCSDYVADCVCVITAGNSRLGQTRQFDAATEDPGKDNLIVSTDPPYYNNISYAVLSDFFYVWLRRSVGELHPDLFATMLTPKVPELIAAANRFGGDQVKAKKHFEQGFKHAFTSLGRRLDHRFPLTVYYAFKQDDEAGNEVDGTDNGTDVDLTTGWETLLEALISSQFQVTATWPVRASQKWRMVSMGTNALASYIVLACRPRSNDAPSTDRRAFVAELRRDLPSALRHLKQGNIAPVDFAQAAIGPGMAIYSQYRSITGSDGRPLPIRAALSLINQTLTEVLAEQEDDFDSETRWAIPWFDQYGFDFGGFGDAELLSKAKVTSISGLEQAGLVSAKAGQVRLLRPDELPHDWDPGSNKRLTVWESTHHLLRLYYYEKVGDSVTANLLRKLSNHDLARDLAYRLFSLCEKNKRSQEAQAYNALVIGWPEIARIAREPAPQMSQTELFKRE